MSDPGSDDAITVEVEGGFVSVLRYTGRPSAEEIRAAVNAELLAWYEREDGAKTALEDALQRAEGAQVPTLLGQASLAEPPSWVEPALRMLDEQPGSKPHE